jgi:hypothetical protein
MMYSLPDKIMSFLVYVFPRVYLSEAISRRERVFFFLRNASQDMVAFLDIFFVKLLSVPKTSSLLTASAMMILSRLWADPVGLMRLPLDIDGQDIASRVNSTTYTTYIT